MEQSNNNPQAATDVYKVLGAVPFLNEPTNLDWKEAVKQLPSSCVDLVVTDPPYGMSYQSNMRQEKLNRYNMTLTPVRRLIFLNVRPKNIWFLRSDEDGLLCGSGYC